MFYNSQNYAFEHPIVPRIMLAKLITYNSQNYAGTLDPGLAITSETTKADEYGKVKTLLSLHASIKHSQSYLYGSIIAASQTFTYETLRMKIMHKTS